MNGSKKVYNLFKVSHLRWGQRSTYEFESKHKFVITYKCTDSEIHLLFVYCKKDKLYNIYKDEIKNKQLNRIFSFNGRTENKGKIIKVEV